MRRGMLFLGWGLALLGVIQTPRSGLAQVVAAGQPMLAASPETLRSFNPQALALSWNNRRWQIMDHIEVLKDFGSSEQEARQALQLIRELGVNQYGTIGSAHPVMEYWLVNGQSPRGLAPRGMRILDLQAATLRVEQVQGQWCLCSGQRVLFTFGPRADEATQALAVVRKYGFTQVGVLGQTVSSMYLFFSRPTDGQASMPSDQGGASGNMVSPRFSRVAKNPDGSPRVERPATSGGLEGVVTALVPPLGSNGIVPPGTSPAAPAIASRQTTLWHEQPHFGRPMQPAQPGAERTPFDWRQVQLRQDEGGWKLTVGSLVLSHFGSNIQQGQMALSAIRYYRFTEQLHAGDVRHPFTYCVSGSQARRGVMLGLASESFEPEKLAVEQTPDGFGLAIGPRVLVSLGDRRDEARRLLEVIKRNKFDRLCQVGGEPGKEGMTFLVRSR